MARTLRLAERRGDFGRSRSPAWVASLRARCRPGDASGALPGSAPARPARPCAGGWAGPAGGAPTAQPGAASRRSSGTRGREDSGSSSVASASVRCPSAGCLGPSGAQVTEGRTAPRRASFRLPVHAHPASPPPPRSSLEPGGGSPKALESLPGTALHQAAVKCSLLGPHSSAQDPMRRWDGRYLVTGPC